MRSRACKSIKRKAKDYLRHETMIHLFSEKNILYRRVKYNIGTLAYIGATPPPPTSSLRAPA